MRTKLILLAILFQFLVLAWMGGQREWILRTGPTVWLRTAPVDPRDLFRGDYVRLNYEISNIPEGKIGPGLKKYLADEQKKNADQYSRRKEIVVYSALRIDPDRQVAQLTTADLTPPSSGLFIKGRVRPYGPGTASLSGVGYGIDSYFVQQGKGRKLERRAPEGMPEGIQVPMDMEVALGRDGTAVLKGYRWSTLGMRVDIQAGTGPEPAKSADTAATQKGTPQPKTIKITLANASSAPVAVVLPADLRTLRFQRLDDWTGPGIDASVPRTDLPPLTDADVRLLQPRETVTVEIDPNKPEWFVKPKTDAPPQSLAQLANADMPGVRVVYEAPPQAACAKLREAGRIWHEPLPSRTISSYEFTSH